MNSFLTEDSSLDEAIASALADLKSFSADEEGYQKAVDQLSKLYKLKHDSIKLAIELRQTDNKHMLESAQAEFERELGARPWFTRVDPNTLITVAANLAVARYIVKYEETGVIRTAVMSFIKKI
jgi:hypothetical protein